MDINIHLVRKCMMRPSVSDPLQGELAGFFSRVCARNPAWQADFNVNVLLASRLTATVTDLDVVVYLVQDVASSVFADFDVAPHPSGHGGRTATQLPGGLSACEVYVRTDPGALLARVAFHEVLHNKTGWGGRLHRHHAGGISAESFLVSTALIDADLDLMGTHLGARHPQWTLG